MLPITAAYLRALQARGVGAGGIDGLARLGGVDNVELARYLQPDGTLSQAGRDFLDQSEAGSSRAAQAMTQQVLPFHLWSWHSLSVPQQEQLGFLNFAEMFELDVVEFAFALKYMESAASVSEALGGIVWLPVAYPGEYTQEALAALRGVDLIRIGTPGVRNLSPSEPARQSGTLGAPVRVAQDVLPVVGQDQRMSEGLRGVDRIQGDAVRTRNLGERTQRRDALESLARPVQSVSPMPGQYRPVTAAIIEEWRQLTMSTAVLPDEVVFIRSHQLYSREWTYYIKRDGTLTDKARELLAAVPARDTVS